MSLVKELFYKTTYVVIFLRKHHDNLFVVSKKKYTNIKKITKIANKQYVIDIENPAYIQDNFRVYFVNADNGKNYIFEETKMPITPDEIDAVIGNNIIRELVRGVLDNKKMKIMYFVGGCIMGFLLGFLVAQNIMQSKIDKIVNTPPVIPMGP